jgi:hypothetical protein
MPPEALRLGFLIRDDLQREGVREHRSGPVRQDPESQHGGVLGHRTGDLDDGPLPAPHRSLLHVVEVAALAGRAVDAEPHLGSRLPVRDAQGGSQSDELPAVGLRLEALEERAEGARRRLPPGREAHAGAPLVRHLARDDRPPARVPGRRREEPPRRLDAGLAVLERRVLDRLPRARDAEEQQDGQRQRSPQGDTPRSPEPRSRGRPNHHSPSADDARQEVSSGVCPRAGSRSRIRSRQPRPTYRRTAITSS